MNTDTTYRALLVAIIQSLDLINKLLKHHHRRVAVVAKHLAEGCGLEETEMKNLVVAASLHDLGALTVHERDQLIQLDVENPEPHEILGAAMLEGLPYFEEVADIIKHHHLRFDSASKLDPKLANLCLLLHLADRFDVLTMNEDLTKVNFNAIYEKLQALGGVVFSKAHLEVMKIVAQKEVFWLDLEHLTMVNLLNDVLDEEVNIPVTLSLLEQFATVLSKVIDYRSEFTATHSQGVSAVAEALGRLMGLDEDVCSKLKIAGLLHDLGKVGVATELIERNGSLTVDEFAEVKSHTYFTYAILHGIPGLKDISMWAASHHERQDGKGYPFKLSHEQMTLPMTIVSYADVFTALTEDRPYRKGMPIEEVMKKMDQLFQWCEYPEIRETLKQNAITLNGIRESAQHHSFGHYQNVKNLIK